MRVETSAPTELDLVTGAVDDPVLALSVGDEEFALFAWAWLYQDTWTLDEHAGFWRANWKRWPRPRRGGPHRNTETLAYALRAMTATGLSSGAAAVALGHPSESLRKRGVLQLAAELPALPHCEVADDVLPRIYAPALEQVPSQHAHPNVSMPAPDDPRAVLLQSAVDACRRLSAGSP